MFHSLIDTYLCYTQVMEKFRSGGYNTLVSTCVGEEGLDIGDVDLIICFDAHKSPIRLVQRMGRTGRKREGRIIMLVTEGKEEQVHLSICLVGTFIRLFFLLFDLHLLLSSFIRQIMSNHQNYGGSEFCT